MGLLLINRRRMRVASILVRTALLAAIVLYVQGADEETDCEKMVCKDTMFAHVNYKAQKKEDGTCFCAPYFTEGPCKDMKCKDGWLATEGNETAPEDKKCECINPCYGKQCTPPYLAVIDYTRQTEGNCKCVWPGDLHVPLNANQTEVAHDADECDKMVCDTKFGFLKYKPEKVNGECKCVAHYQSGPCKDQVCPDGYLVLETKDGKCGCSNPCEGMVCEPPSTPMIDYIRETEALCKCVEVNNHPDL